MKICMVSPNYPPNQFKCGVGDYTYHLCQTMYHQGHEIVVIASTQYLASQNETNIQVIPFAHSWDLRTLLKFRHWVTRQDIDIVNIQYSPSLYGPNFKLLPLLLYNLVPVVTTFHTLMGGTAYNKLLAWILLSCSTKSISANEEVTYLINKRFQYLKGKVVEIPIGSNITPPGLDARRCRTVVCERLNAPLDTLLLTHFGLFYPGKGVETLLRAVRLLREYCPAFRLLMIGGLWPGAESYYEQLRALATEYQLDRWVHWIGYCPVEEVSTYLLASDLCVLPYDDGISSRRGSLMAALAHCVPVISTHPRIPSAYFKDGENVSLVPPRDPEALRDRIMELMMAAQKRTGLSQNGVQLLRVFAWPRIGQQTLELYAQVSHSRTA